MTERSPHNSATYECVDKDAEAVPGSQVNTNGGLFYYVELHPVMGYHVLLTLLRRSSPVL